MKHRILIAALALVALVGVVTGHSLAWLLAGPVVFGMFIDALGLVSSTQQVTADAISTNSIDLGNVTPKRVIGDGEPMGFACSIVAVGTNTGSLVVQSISSTAANLASSAKVMGEVDLVAADLIAGKQFFVPIDPGYPAERYIGLYYDVTGTVDVSITAALMPQSMYAAKAKAYAKGYTIS